MTSQDWDSEELKRDALRYILPNFADNVELGKERPYIFVRGEGCYVYDIDGNRYLDTFASLLTTISGHNRPEVARAVQEQMSQLEFFPNYVDGFTVPAIRLAKKLAEIAPGDLSVTFFVNDGSEACETAIKLAKQYFWEKGERSRYKIVARRYCYHGATYGGLSATGLPWFREPFHPLTPGFVHVMPPYCYRCELGLEPSSCGIACLRQTEEVIRWEGPKSVAAVIVDPIAGSNTGYPVPPDGYLQGLRELCDRYGILLIFDEVQTGFGKTGRMFGCEHWGVAPDIMAIAKGFSGGYLPLGATLLTPRIAEAFSKPGSEFRHGHTYAGHPTACAAALANIEIIEREDLVARAARMGDYLRSRLEDLYRYPVVGDVRGIGLLLAVELVADRVKRTPIEPSMAVGSWIRNRCYELGIILRNNGDILVLAPSLILTKEQADETVDTLHRVIPEAIDRFGL
ncbi:MAG: aspartate aminotransferase family protein [Anaerolineae bacterium]|nr:aspartate aminotransferase family protein [Anaerolineae bacterium]